MVSFTVTVVITYVQFPLHKLPQNFPETNVSRKFADRLGFVSERFGRTKVTWMFWVVTGAAATKPPPPVI